MVNWPVSLEQEHSLSCRAELVEAHAWLEQDGGTAAVAATKGTSSVITG